MSTLTSPTLQNLLTNVRSLLNQRGQVNSFWTDVELTSYINEGVRLYFVECVLANEGYFTTTTNLDIVSGVETIALPADCFEVKNLWKAVNNGYQILPYNNSTSLSYSTNDGNGAETYTPCYYFRGNSIVLRGTPNFSQPSGLLLEYIQFPDQMVWGGDSLTNQVSPIFKQLIEIYAVYKAKLKESMVNGVMMHKIPEENLATLYKSFKDAIAKRSKYPTHVQAFNPEC